MCGGLVHSTFHVWRSADVRGVGSGVEWFDQEGILGIILDIEDCEMTYRSEGHKREGTSLILKVGTEIGVDVLHMSLIMVTVFAHKSTVGRGGEYGTVHDLSMVVISEFWWDKSDILRLVRGAQEDCIDDGGCYTILILSVHNGTRGCEVRQYNRLMDHRSSMRDECIDSQRTESYLDLRAVSESRRTGERRVETVRLQLTLVWIGADNSTLYTWTEGRETGGGQIDKGDGLRGGRTLVDGYDMGCVASGMMCECATGMTGCVIVVCTYIFDVGVHILVSGLMRDGERVRVVALQGHMDCLLM
ncbi:hypothetical protein Tco_1176720 [Tanacetum coccineum]